jgi:uncharacterized protein YebE (UPF0316 family)
MDLFLNCLIIFLVRIVDVSLGTLSTVLVIRGKKGLGSIIGFIDLVIWFLVVRQALSIESASLWIAIAYAGGYATGTYAGSWLEEKIALGKSSLIVVTKGLRHDLVKLLRNRGFGVSEVKSQGINGENLLLLIEVQRKKIKNVIDVINEVASDSFITVSDTKEIINGYFGR